MPANNHLFSQEQEETKINAINSTLKKLGYDPSDFKELVSIILQLIAHDPVKRMSVEDAYIKLEALQLKTNKKFGVMSSPESNPHCTALCYSFP